MLLFDIAPWAVREATKDALEFRETREKILGSCCQRDDRRWIGSSRQCGRVSDIDADLQPGRFRSTLALITSLAFPLSVAAGLGYEPAIVLPKSRGEARSLLTICQIFTLLSIIVLFVMIVPLRKPLSEWLKAPELLTLALWFPLATAFLSLNRIYDHWLARERRFPLMAVSKVTGASAGALTKILLGLATHGAAGSIIDWIHGLRSMQSRVGIDPAGKRRTSHKGFVASIQGSAQRLFKITQIPSSISVASFSGILCALYRVFGLFWGQNGGFVQPGDANGTGPHRTDHPVGSPGILSTFRG